MMASDFAPALLCPVGYGIVELHRLLIDFRVQAFTVSQPLRWAFGNGCKEFVACNEGNIEIAISYWESESQIKEWKQNIEHITAQGMGKSKWYKSYSVQVTNIVREYSSRT